MANQMSPYVSRLAKVVMCLGLVIEDKLNQLKDLFSLFASYVSNVRQKFILLSSYFN